MSTPTTPGFDKPGDGPSPPSFASHHAADSLAYHGTSLPIETPTTRVAEFRRQLREPAAEFLGTLILVLFGTAANCQVVLSKGAKGDWLSGCVGWGFGIALGVWVSGGISGGHINPAVTLAMAIFRRFSWRKVPIFWLAQLLGAFCGALITYGVYWNAIDGFEGVGVRTIPGTAGLFGTFPLDYVTNVAAFFTEFLATALLVMTVYAATDRYNNAPPAGLVPLVVFLAMTGLAATFGAQTSFAMNPARDFGPRLMSAIFYGRKVFTFRHHYWIWCPIIADFSGAIAGAFVYDAFLYIGTESPVSVPHEDSHPAPKDDTIV